MNRRLLGLPVLAAVAAACLPGVAAAAKVPVTTTTMPGFKAPGTPSKLNKVFVTKYGPKKPKRVVVLIPGTSGGAGDFTNVAENVVKSVKGTAVWAIDRRSQALEDTSMFKKLLSGKATQQQAIDYYLGWIGDPSITKHYVPQVDKNDAFALKWGLNVSLEDIHRVVRAARKVSHHKVMLGGHSLGGSTTVAYAVWDFAGQAAWKDLSGLVLIDGAAAGKGATVPDLAATKKSVEDFEKAGQPWLNLLKNVPLPWTTGVFVELGAIAARLDPKGVSQVNSLKLLPAMFKTGFPVTNEAQLGFALDESTSPPDLGLIHVRAGSLATSGDPRQWVPGEVTPIANVARAFGQEPSNGTEWYFPVRLTMDLRGLAGLQPNAVTRYLGLHPKYAKQVKLPVYAIQSSLSKGGLKKNVDSFVAMNHSKLTFVNAEKSNSHLDPLLAAPKTSAFLKTFVPWLKKNGR